MIEFGNFIGPPRPTEIRLRWTDPTRQFALYRFRGDPDSIPALGQPVERYCCSAEVVANIDASGYFDAIAVAFERTAGGLPGPSDIEPFELTVRPIH